MKINPINCYNPVYFLSSRTKILDKVGNSVNCHYTNFNREDINWDKFANFLAERYANQKQTKINIYGCSDGSEAYTLLLALDTLGSETTAKFKIYASDISPKIIEQAQKGEILLSLKDIQFLEKKNAMQYFKYDTKKDVQIIRDVKFYPYIVSDKLKNRIEFSLKNIRDDAQYKDYSNQVVMFRNGWTFNSLDDQNRIANGLFNGSNKKTLIVIGQADLYKSNAAYALINSGFKEIKSDIFTGLETNYESNTIGEPEEKLNVNSILFEK